MSIEDLIIKLKPNLIEKIEEAFNKTDDEIAVDSHIRFPWLGDDCYHILADAVICVLRGIYDSQNYMEKEGMLMELIQIANTK